MHDQLKVAQSIAKQTFQIILTLSSSKHNLKYFGFSYTFQMIVIGKEVWYVAKFHILCRQFIIKLFLAEIHYCHTHRLEEVSDPLVEAQTRS